MLTEQQIQEQIDFVIEVITHPAGYDLDLFGSLCVRPTDQGVWCVSWKPDRPLQHNGRDIYEIEKSFPTAEEAAEFFVRKRYQEKIGLDFEKVSFNQSRECDG
jgi:hypothetical protein